MGFNNLKWCKVPKNVILARLNLKESCFDVYYPRDRPHYISQLSDIGFIGKVYSLMVTSSQIWIIISPILNVPNLKVIYLVEKSTILSKQTKCFTHLLLSFCKSGGTRCPCFVFTSISTSYLTSVKPNLSWTTQQSTFSADRLRFEISQMSK